MAGGRRARGGQPVVNPLGRTHRYLTFHQDYPETTRYQFSESLAANINQPIEVFDSVDWNVFDRVMELDGFSTGRETISNMLAAPYYLDDGNVGFVSHAWFRMFSIREHMYREPVVEFYSTFRFNHRETDFSAVSITFQLGGVPRAMSLVEFSVAIGLYEPNEIHNPYFVAHLEAGAVKKLNSIQVEEEWRNIANGPYGSIAPSYRHIRDPRHRFIHRLLTYTIVGRREGPEKVSQPDLFYLSSIIRKRLVNVPWRLARWMSKRATGTRDTSSLCGGQFVTRLARHFGLETPGELGTCTMVQPDMGWLTARRLEIMEIIVPCSVTGGSPDMYYWVATTPLGQAMVPRQGRGRGDTSGSEAGRGTASGRNRGYAADFGRLSQQLEQLSLGQTQRFDQLELMQRQHFHQTSAHLDYQDGLFSQIFGHSGLPYEPFHYQMPQEFMPPSADQPGPSHHYHHDDDSE